MSRNETVPEHSRALCTHITNGCFCATAESSSCNRDSMAQKAKKYLLSSPLRRKFCQSLHLRNRSWGGGVGEEGGGERRLQDNLGP